MQLARETLAQSIQLIRGLGNEARFSRGMAQFYLGITHMRLGEFATAQRYAEQALVLFEEIQDAYGLACCHYALGRIQIEQGQMLAARTHLEQAENWSCTAGDRLVIFLVLESLQLMAVSEGDFTKALALIQQGLEITRQMKDNWMISGALRESGNIAQVTGDYAQAASLFRESGELSQQQGLLGDLARARYNQGYVAILQGDLPAGAAYFQESWSLFSQVENRRGQTEVLDGWAAFSAANGQDELAARLLGTADASFQQQGAGRWPVDLLEYQKLHGNLLDRLGEERFGEAYAAGQGLSIEQALEEVDRIAP
jgi:tetratricopeptide (TPR) repeat protein